MAATVFLHIGLPKTGTTYLQQILWDNAPSLRDQGMLIPGRGHREHLWAALDAQERPNLASRHRRAPGSWRRLVERLAGWPGAGVVTHEFICGATPEQAQRMVADLAPAEVHVVITARHALGMLTAGWQESVKNGGTQELADAGRARGPGKEFSWRTWDLAGVLERWGDAVPPDRVHLLPVPGRDQPADQHWLNFAGVLGLEPAGFRLPAAAANPSLGVVQVELLRRINAELVGFDKAADRGVWIRGFLAETHLAAQPGTRISPSEAQIHDCRRRSERAVRLIGDNGYDVRGDPAQLLVPTDLPTATRPDEVTDAELVDSAAALVAGIMTDVRELKQQSPRRRGGQN